MFTSINLTHPPWLSTLSQKYSKLVLSIYEYYADVIYYSNMEWPNQKHHK